MSINNFILRFKGIDRYHNGKLMGNEVSESILVWRELKLLLKSAYDIGLVLWILLVKLVLRCRGNDKDYFMVMARAKRA